MACYYTQYILQVHVQNTTEISVTLSDISVRIYTTHKTAAS